MTFKRSTKSALLMSVLSLFLCFVMLLGTTFAWFTDSVSSKNNIITAGNLDIELKYAKLGADGKLTSWEKVQDKSDIFDPNALWEPGRVEVVYLEVSNLGSLALKYQLGVNVYGEQTGTNVFGDTFKLSDYLVFTTVEMPTELTTYTDREAAMLASGSAMGMKDYESKTTNLEVGGVDYVALIIYMPETVGNVANYKTGTTAPSVTFGINLYATQQAYENDSYGSDYDADAFLPTVYSAGELVSALEQGESVKLGADITLDASGENGNFVIPATAGNVTLNLNGHTLTAPARTGYANRTQYAFDNYANLTIKGNGTVNSRGIQNYGTLTVENGVIINALDTNGGAGVWAYAGSNTVINGGTFTASESAGCLNISGELTINGGEFVQTETSADDQLWCYAIRFNGTTAVVKDATVAAGSHGAIAITAGNVTIDGGSFTCTGVVGQSDHVIYTEGGTATIIDGTYIGDHDAGGKCLYGSDKTEITVSGGVYSDDPSARATIADGFSVAANDGKYYVLSGSAVIATPDNVNTVIANAAAGQTVYLWAGEYHETIVAKSNITILGTDGAVVDCVNLNGANNVTIKNVEFDAAGAKYGCNGNGKNIQPANIVGRANGSKVSGGTNIVIEGCVFGGTFADGGVCIAFTDQGTTPYSNVTINNCTFAANGGYTDIYTFYSGNGAFVITNNTFASKYAMEVSNMLPLYLGKYQSSTPIVVTGNTFENYASFDKVAYLQDHSNYGVSFGDTTGNTFNG